MTNKRRLGNSNPNFSPPKKVRLATNYSRLIKEFNAGLSKVESANKSNLLRTKKGKYYYLRKQKAFTDHNGIYQPCVNVLNWKSLLFDE